MKKSWSMVLDGVGVRIWKGFGGSKLVRPTTNIGNANRVGVQVIRFASAVDVGIAKLSRRIFLYEFAYYNTRSIPFQIPDHKLEKFPCL